MWPYVLLILLPALIRYIDVSRTEIRVYKNVSASRNTQAMRFFWVFLFILLVLRHETVGRDLNTYKYIWNELAQSTWKEAIDRSTEVAYSVMNKLLLEVTDNFRWSMILSAFLSVYGIAKTYERYSNDTVLTIVLFVSLANFIMLFSGLRQAITIAIGCMAFELVRKKKPILFIIMVLVSMLFHRSAFILLLLYPLYYVRINRKTLIFVIPALAVLMVFSKQVFIYLIPILHLFADYEVEIMSTGAYTMIYVFLILAAFSFLIPDESKLDCDTIAMRNYLLLAVGLQMFAPLHNLAMRMNYYFMAFIPLLIPRIIERRSKAWEQVAVVCRYIFIFVFALYFFVKVQSDNDLFTFPYHFFWEKV